MKPKQGIITDESVSLDSSFSEETIPKINSQHKNKRRQALKLSLQDQINLFQAINQIHQNLNEELNSSIDSDQENFTPNLHIAKKKRRRCGFLLTGSDETKFYKEIKSMNAIM